jgi:hypothetical protein
MSWEQLTLWSGDLLANLSASQDTEKDLMTTEASSCSTTLELLQQHAPNGSSGKMSRASYPMMVGEPLEPSSGRWLTSGIVYAGECWTANTLVSPKDVKESSLSDVLQNMESVHPKYCLSKRSAEGILRRARERNKKIPEKLKAALESIVAKN